MDRIRAVIADDERPARRRVRALLARHADFETVAEAESGAEAIGAVETHRPEVLFLDVAMPEMTGIQVMESLGIHAVPVVVFVTAYDSHAISAFDHFALDYVLKPIDERRFDRTLTRIRERLSQWRTSAVAGEVSRRLERCTGPGVGTNGRSPHLTRLVLKSTHRITFVPVGDIDWIEAEGDYVRLHTGRTSHLYRSTLSALEQRLDPREFVRIHRSSIVRWSRVRELQPYFRGEYIVTLQDGTQLKWSRSYRDRLETMLG